MKDYFFLAFLVFFIACSKKDIEENPTNFNSGNISKVITFGGSKNDAFQAVTNTSDGGFAVLGYTQSKDFDITDKPNEGYDFWVQKFDSQGSVLWNKTYGGTLDDRGNDILQTSDGGFAILGFSESNNEDVSENFGRRDYWITKLSNSGIIEWEKSFGFSGNDFGVKLIQTKDNGFLLIGELDVTASGGQGNSRSASRHAGGDYWVIKLNQNGIKEWSRFFGGSFTDTPNDVVQTQNGDYIIVGSSDSNDVDITSNKGSYDFWVVKIATNGDLIWQKNFGGSEIDEARGIATTADGNFLIVGDTRSSDGDISVNKGGADLWIIKIDTNGNLIWEKSFGGTSFDVARSVSRTRDNDFIISGSSRSSDSGFTNQGQNDAWILKISSEGNLEWQKFVGGSEIDFAYDAVELNNGSIIAVGDSYSNNGDITVNKGFSDALMIKID